MDSIRKDQLAHDPHENGIRRDGEYRGASVWAIERGKSGMNFRTCFERFDCQDFGEGHSLPPRPGPSIYPGLSSAAHPALIPRALSE